MSTGDELLKIQTAEPPTVEIVVADDPFVRRSLWDDFSIYWFVRHDMPRTSHVALGATMPLHYADDGTVWAAGEFAHGSVTHVTGQPGSYRISPLAAPLLNKPDSSSNPSRLKLVHPFVTPLLNDAPLTKQEAVIEAGQYIWFINGGAREVDTAEDNNWNRIIRFDRAGTDLNSTFHDDRFCVYHVPTNNAGVLGIDWDEATQTIWYVESRSPLETTPVLGWFKPDELNCENELDYSLAAPGATYLSSATTQYCASASDTHCIHTIELVDWETPIGSPNPRSLIGQTGQVMVEDDAVWVAGYYSSNLARYDRNLDKVDIIDVNPPQSELSLQESFLGTGPWQFASTTDYLYFTETNEGDVVRLDKQALASDATGHCKIPPVNDVNPCLSEIHATDSLKDVRLHENRLYFGGIDEFGYINLDTWTPETIYTGINAKRNPDTDGIPFLSGDLSVGPGGSVIINDYTGRSVLRFYPLPP